MPKKNNPGCNCCATAEPHVNCSDLCSNANVPATLYLHDGVNTPLALTNIGSGTSCRWRGCRTMAMTGTKVTCGTAGTTNPIPVAFIFSPGGVGGAYNLAIEIPVFSFGGVSWDAAVAMTCAQLLAGIDTGTTGCSGFDGSTSPSSSLLVPDQTGALTISSCTLGSFSASITLTTESTTTSSGNVGNFAAFYGTSRSLTFTINEVAT